MNEFKQKVKSVLFVKRNLLINACLFSHRLIKIRIAIGVKLYVCSFKFALDVASNFFFSF